MGSGFQFLDIILFGAIAAFLVLRLRSVLGRRTGHEGRPDFDPFRQQEQNEARRREEEAAEEGKVVTLPDSRRRTPTEEEPVASQGSAGLTSLKLADRSFDEREFLEGARIAFEMIVGAFAANDAKALRPLLADEVFRNFASAIQGREARSETLETTLVGIVSAEIIEVEMQRSQAFVTVKFVSEQVNVTKDSEGRIVDGDPNEVVRITDIWTFMRDVSSRDPNWTLVAPRTPN